MLAAVAGALPPPGAVGRAFWERDLPAVVARLVEPPIDATETAQHQLFADLVRLVTCEPLGSVEPVDGTTAMLRLLVRAEAVRGRRLGPAAAASETVWRDILDPSFFTWQEPPAPPEGYLYWPVEQERWPVERVHVKLRPSSCAEAIATPHDELAVLADEKLVAHLDARAESDAEVWGDARSRLAYHRAVRRLAAGDVAGAASEARRIEVARLPASLRPWAALARLETAVDPEEGYLALRGQPLDAAASLWVLHRSVLHLWGKQKWNEVLVTAHRALEAHGGERDPARQAVVEDVAYRYALALGAVGQREKQREALRRFFPAWAASSGAAVDALRELALDDLATRTLDKDALDLVRALGTPDRFGRRLQLLGSRALTLGFAQTSSAAADALAREALPRTRALGHALLAERSVVLQDRAALEQAMARLSTERKDPRLPAREREELDKVSLELAQALVSRSVPLGDKAWVRLIRLQLEQLRQTMSARHQKAFEQFYAALEQAPPAPSEKARKREAYVAVGEVDVGLPAVTVPGPRLTLRYPEPHSLLAIPADLRTLRPWFEPSPPAAPPSAGAVTEVSHAK